MQETRRYILDVLRESGHATVDSIVDALREKRGKDITAVTVRHHLNILQQEGLITEPELRHRSTPGRPQHLYMLTDKAEQAFPNNYQTLISGLVAQLENHLPSNEINVIFEGVADHMVANFQLPDAPLTRRMDLVVDYLNQHGYDAFWEMSEEGAILHTRNCPYHQIAHTTDTLCSMDLRLIVSLVGIVPRRLSRVSQGDETCAYLLPIK